MDCNLYTIKRIFKRVFEGNEWDKMYKRKPKYEVLNHNNEIIISGDILSEIISTTILETFKYLENSKSLLYKIERNYYSFYNILSGIYKNSEYFYWDNIKQIELIHNNSDFLSKENFVKFRKNTWILINSKLKIELNLNKELRWKLYKF